MEEAFETIGTKGKFQKIIIAIVIIVGGMALFLSTAFPFLTKRPEFLCRPVDQLTSEFEPCHETDLCKPQFFEYKLNPEDTLDNWSRGFELYCEKGFYVPLIGSSFFFGGIIASLFLSQIPDKFGRETIYKILLVTQFLLHLNCIFAFSPVHIVVVNFLSGFNSFAYSMAACLITEYLDKNMTGIIMSLNNSVFDVAGVVCALYFIYINNVKLLFIITSTLCFISAWLTLTYFVESPRWLSSKNRIHECFGAMRKIAKVNGREDKLDQFLEKNAKLINSDNTEIDTSSDNIFQIFRYKSQQKKLIYLSYVWFCIGFTFYGLIINMENLEGDFYTVSIVTFLAEFASEMSSGWLADEYGRVAALKISAYIGGYAFLVYSLISLPALVTTILLFLVSLGFSAAFNVIFIYSPEAFPTSIRSTVMGYLYLLSRLGALFVAPVCSIIPHTELLFAILSLTSGYVSGLLDETLGKDFMDDIPEKRKQGGAFTNRSRTASKSSESNKKSLHSVASDSYFLYVDEGKNNS